MVDGLAVVAGGSYGAVAGGMVLGLLATAAGVPTGTGGGEIIPGFGWNRFTAFLIGLPIGFAVGAVVVVRAARRWQWLVGVPVAVIGLLVIVPLLADPSQWDGFFWFLLVPAIPGIAFVAWYFRRRRGR